MGWDASLSGAVSAGLASRSRSSAWVDRGDSTRRKRRNGSVVGIGGAEKRTSRSCSSRRLKKRKPGCDRRSRRRRHRRRLPIYSLLWSSFSFPQLHVPLVHFLRTSLVVASYSRVPRVLPACYKKKHETKKEPKKKKKVLMFEFLPLDEPKNVP